MGTYHKTSNAQIARNSLLLYVRTFMTIFISIYTSRMVLLKLGENDFGIFSVVGGVATIFSFLGSSLFIGTQRYLTLAIVNSSVDEFKKIFTTSIHCYLALSLITLILGECLGVYFVNNILNIDSCRLTAANYAYQFSLCSLVLNLMNSPYKASIIAFEKYSYYAYTDIVFKILRLAIVFALALSPTDRLVTYSALYMSVSILSSMADMLYCHIRFDGCRFIRYWNKQLFLEITKFSTLSLFKKTAETCNSQGNNILVNIYGGVVASASFGLSNQVWGTLTGFFLNLQTAFSPQITKSYGASDLRRFNALILDSCRFSCYMVIFLAIPLVINMPLALQIWLEDVPRYAVPFCTVVIFSCFISALTNPLNTAITAIGKIKRYQIVTSIIYFASIPAALISLHFGMALAGVFVIKIFCQIAETVYSAAYLSRFVEFDTKTFAKDCVTSCMMLLFCTGVPYVITVLTDMGMILSAIVTTITGEALFATAVWQLGLTQSQKGKIRSYVVAKTNHIIRIRKL